jgi:hypothetical protein
MYCKILITMLATTVKIMKMGSPENCVKIVTFGPLTAR